jgi:lipopolysaccharide export system protein LptA
MNTAGLQRARPLAILSALALAAALGLLPAGGAGAQAVSDSFGGFSTDSNAPIDIEADTLEVLDAEQVAIFRGNVKAVQGDMTLRSKTLHVSYTGDEGMQDSCTEITRIRAEGPVIITTKEDQTSTSDWALFDVKSQTVTIGGNVVLSQGENVIKGDRLVIDLKTGRSRFENPDDVASDGRKRVKGLFMPQQDDKAKTDENSPVN